MDPAQKQAIMMAILAFNFTFIIFMVVFNSTMPPLAWGFSGLKLLLGVLIAGGAAAGAYFASRMSR